MGGNDTNVEPHKGNDDHVPVVYQPTNMSSDWQGSGNNLTNTSIGMIPMNNSMVQSSPSFSSAPMVDSFWDPSMNGQSLGYCEVNVQNVSVRAGGMGWNPNAMPRRGSFLPHTIPGMLPQNLPQFPADSGFIERAARFSCFSGGNFGEMMNPFSLPDPYSRSLGSIVQGPHEVLAGSGSKPLSMTGVTNDVSLHGVCGTEGSPFKNEKKSESFVHSRDEAKHGANVSGNEPDEAEFSGRGAQEELDGVAGECSGKGLGSKKRKRNGQDMTGYYENNEAPLLSKEKAKESSEDKQKVDQNPTSSGKPGGKNGKQGSQGSDPPKEDYIHIRARRGQATNSHSLAERVRREKISERMKYLQDLVPGCSKVTGKAVMLDEIINYVQSLQRQVEFLSMKLATVNPRLDFNVEGFLAKDILQFRGGLSSPLAFHPDMTMPFPPQHPSQTGLMQASLPSLGNSSEALGRPINLQPSALCGGFKEHTSQVPGSWEDELHNIVHMGGFGTTAALSSQDLSASLPPRHMKSEP